MKIRFYNAKILTMQSEDIFTPTAIRSRSQALRISRRAASTAR